jgi:hypothetical protein
MKILSGFDILVSINDLQVEKQTDAIVSKDRVVIRVLATKEAMIKAFKSIGDSVDVQVNEFSQITNGLYVLVNVIISARFNSPVKMTMVYKKRKQDD